MASLSDFILPVLLQHFVQLLIQLLGFRGFLRLLFAVNQTAGHNGDTAAITAPITAASATERPSSTGASST